MTLFISYDFDVFLAVRIFQLTYRLRFSMLIPKKSEFLSFS